MNPDDVVRYRSYQKGDRPVYSVEAVLPNGLVWLHSRRTGKRRRADPRDPRDLELLTVTTAPGWTTRTPVHSTGYGDWVCPCVECRASRLVSTNHAAAADG